MLAACGVAAACRGEPQKILQHTPNSALPAKAALDKMPAKGDLALFRLDQVNFKIPTGASIGSYYYRRGRCARRKDEGVYLKSSQFTAKDLQFRVAFHDLMKKENYRIAGDPLRPFDARTEAAEYLVAAEIKHISISLCERIKQRWRFISRIGAQEGTGSISVDWQVYSMLARRVVFRATTDGAASVSQPIPDAWSVIIYKSFEDSVAGLAADPEFAGALKPREMIRATAQNPRKPISIRPYRYFIRPFRDNSNRILRAAVTIEAGQSHGSGFFITSSGLLLTNQHVVGNAKNVRVRLVGGTTLKGTVLRRDKPRDVALVEIDAEGTQPLPIREKPVKVGEEVFAIGTPLEKFLNATVSKGIVSAKRRAGADLPLIQADVDIHGGSSGGPLLDRFGNVIGLTFAGVGMTPGKKSVGLNFFIPIGDALKKLNLVIEKRGKRPGGRAQGG